MAIWSALAGSIVKGVSGFVERRQEHAKIKTAGKLKIASAKIEFKVAKWQARATRLAAKESNDASYDMQVLKNREHSYADEFLIGMMMLLFLMHFVPVMQPYMVKGWAAMGYSGVPWWFEFVMVGIFVSTLGLMRLFRLFWTRRAPPEKTGD